MLIFLLYFSFHWAFFLFSFFFFGFLYFTLGDIQGVLFQMCPDGTIWSERVSVSYSSSIGACFHQTGSIQNDETGHQARCLLTSKVLFAVIFPTCGGREARLSQAHPWISAKLWPRSFIDNTSLMRIWWRIKSYVRILYFDYNKT